MSNILQIKSYDYWFKGIGTLQQNWLLIESDVALLRRPA